MKLSKLIKNLKVKSLINFNDFNIKNLSISSKSIDKNGLFFAIKGNNVNGEDYVFEAVKNGAVAVVTESQLLVDIPQIIVEDVRIAMALICKVFYNNCDTKLKIISVVGTNGKTTTSTIIYKILQESGKNVGLIGTNGVYMNDLYLPNNFTTPDTIDLFYIFNQMASFNIEYVIIELSAHAIYYNKMFGVKNEITVFTNITPEHLDFFGTFENYAKVKCDYFNKLNTKECVVNVDDEYGKSIAYNCNVPCVSYGLAYPANAFAIDIKTSINGSSFIVNVENDVLKVSTNLVGDYNVYNILASITVAKMLKISNEIILKSLKKINVPGRWEVFDFKNNNKVIVDYAHTPDGFEKVLSLIKSLRPKSKIITVFGCVGYSNKQKRESMGKVASKYSNYVVLSEDNLCGENFEDVCDDITLTVPNVRIPNRKDAVTYAYGMLNKNDTLVLLGKGNESYQKGIDNIYYNEIEVVKELQKQENFE